MSTQVFCIEVDPRDDFDTALTIAVSDVRREVQRIFNIEACNDCTVDCTAEGYPEFYPCQKCDTVFCGDCIEDHSC